MLYDHTDLTDMTDNPNTRVDVIAIFTHEAPSFQSGTKIFKVRWNNRDYKVTEFGLHHLESRGKILHHIFSVCTATVNFKLSLNSKTLVWRLEGVSDAARYLSS
jgi:hypothetical protein